MHLRADIAVAFALLSGCDFAFRLDRVPSVGDGGPDAPPSYLCTFTEPPMVLPGFNSDARNPSQREDKLELWFARVAGTDLDMFVARRDQTSEPYAGITAVPELSSSSKDDDPAIQPGALRIFLLSTRVSIVQRLFEATRTSVVEPFGEPVLVGTGSALVSGYDVSLDGRTLYTNNSAGDLRVLTRAGDTGDFGGLEVVAAEMPINDPSVAGDGLTIYYDRSGVIYRQTRETAVPTSTAFSGESLVAMGSDADISADGKTLIFESASGFSMLECP